MSLERRVTNLELSAMQLERLVEELSTVVAEQQKTIDGLAALVQAHATRLKEMPEQAPDEKPPHY